MIRRLTFAFTVASLAMAAQAQLIVNEDLGSINGPTAINITGTTLGAGDEAAYYDGANPAGNWGEDYVYQFTTTVDLTYQANTNSLTGDPDFFLLNSLSTANDGVKDFANDVIQNDFLDGTPPDFGVPALLTAGTYYLSIDSWHGADGAVVPMDSTWDATLNFTGAPTISCLDAVLLDDGFYDRAAGGDADHPYGVQEFTVDTSGVYNINQEWAGFDGYLYLFDAPFAGDDSTNIAFDDDFNGFDNSQIESVSLNAGQSYYLVSTTFAGMAGVTDLASVKATFSGPGTASLVPEPSGLGLMLFGLLSLGMRRRS